MSLQDQKDRLLGHDIFFDLASATGADTVDAPNGDWLTVRGREALRQSVLRRILTSPGEWRNNPNYGIGAREFIKARNTKANRDQLANRIRSQLLQDDRILEVTDVLVDLSTTDVVKMKVMVRARGDILTNKPIEIRVEF